MRLLIAIIVLFSSLLYSQDSLSIETKIVDNPAYYYLTIDGDTILPRYSKESKAILRGTELAFIYGKPVILKRPDAIITGKISGFKTVVNDSVIDPVEIPTDTEKVLAFPTAKGAGANVTGGRGGKVLHVTTLEWNDTEGSFKWALKQKYPRIIVFDVSGEIDATSEGNWSTLIQGDEYSNLTIAGQTAPKGGIALKTSFLQIHSVNNIIVRNIRFRGAQMFDTASTLWVFSCSDVIFDHCVFSHGKDEGIDFATSEGESTNITVQNCFYQNNSKGGIFGSDTRNEIAPLEDLGEYTFINNVITNTSHRFPNIQGNGRGDVVNNVVYNWKFRLSRTNMNGKHNFINNYYKPAKEGLRRSSWYGNGTIDRLHKMQVSVNDNPIIYASGSIITGQRDTPFNDDRDMFSYFWGSDFPENTQVADKYFTSEMHDIVGEVYDIETAEEAYSNLIVEGKVGIYKYINDNGGVSIYRDEKDIYYLNQIFEDSYEAPDTADENGDFLQPVSFYEYSIIPENTRPSNFYLSNPHIPEVWFKKYVPEGKDEKDISPSGYSYFEEYINMIDR